MPFWTSKEWATMSKVRKAVPPKVQGAVGHFLRTDVGFQGMLAFTKWQDEFAELKGMLE
jgi:hypothetical protein